MTAEGDDRSVDDPESSRPVKHSPVAGARDASTSGAADTGRHLWSGTTETHLPEQFGRYRIIRELGGGGMGRVYLAHDSQLDRRVALKVPRFSPDDGPELIERFYREARSMATLDHPNLCRVHDVAEINGIHFLTMAYIEGQPLSELATSQEFFTCDEAVRIVVKLALALHEAHQADVIHRDLKLSNVMIDRRGEPIIVDFGLARRAGHGESDLTSTGAILGTPAYMSPEQVKGDLHSIGPGTDIYSLGVMLYRLLTGSVPFEGEPVAILSGILLDPPKPPSTLRPDIDPALEAICLKAIAKDAGQRYSSMLEFAQALQGDVLPGHEDVTFVQSASKNPLVTGYAYDIFVSYAPADDEPPPGRAAGWVSTLVRNLEWRLHQLCGRTDAVSVTMGHRPQQDAAGQSTGALAESATVLVILSPGYVDSVWCRPELEPFRQDVQERIARGRTVFLLERDQLDREALPREIAGLRSHQFWEDPEGRGPRILGHPQPDAERDRDYYAKIDDLARHMHGVLKQLQAAPDATLSDDTTEPTSSESPPDAIYLAEVTDELDPLRDEVRRYLEQSGFRVLPEAWYSRDPREFQEAVARDLKDCVLFAQLLGSVAGKKPPGATSSYPALQYECATVAGKPILQWRDPMLDPSGIVDAAHRSLVTGSEVQAMDIEQFKRQILTQAQREMEKRQAEDQHQLPTDAAFVFVDVGREDQKVVEELCEILDQSGCAYALPVWEGQPDEIRKDLEANLIDCDGLIVVYGDIPEPWVREQLRLWRRTLHLRQKPLQGLAVYDGPPPEKPRLGMKLPKMQVIECRHGVQKEKVRNFLSGLGSQGE
jgi:serine/threonine protein kinase